MRLVLVAVTFAAVSGWAQTGRISAAETMPPPAPKGAVPAKPTPVPKDATPSDDQAEIKSKMAESLAKQRVAAMQQITAVMGKPPTPAPSFYTVPWIETPVPFSQPPCDPLPTAELDKLVQEGAQQEGVKPELIRGVIAQESGGRPCAVSWKGAQGLMQLMPATSEQFGVKNPFDPRQNVEAGTKLLKQLMTKYKDDISLVLAAYNAGEGRVDRDGGVPQIPETQNYVNEIQSKLPKN